LIELAIAKIKNGSKIPDEIKVTAKEFGETWGIPTNNAFQELKSTQNSLFEREIRLKKLNENEFWKIRWIDAVGYQEGEGYIKFSFSPHIRDYLENLKDNFTKYKLLEIKSLKSAYSIRLYELIMQYKKTGWRGASVEELKNYFGVADKYPLWNDFNRYVLNKSIKEINSATDYVVVAEPKKKGRSVVAVNLYFSLKKQKSIEFS
jgi:plasmid replication initiation protein